MGSLLAIKSGSTVSLHSRRSENCGAPQIRAKVQASADVVPCDPVAALLRCEAHSFEWGRRHPVSILDASMQPRNFASQSGHIRWEDGPAAASPRERERSEIQNYMNEAKRIADQRDLLAYIKYGSSKYREKLLEVERYEQNLAERRRILLNDYPNRAELQKLSALERRREIIARESRFYGVSACIAGLLMAVAGISGFVYCRVLHDGTSGNPLFCWGWLPSACSYRSVCQSMSEKRSASCRAFGKANLPTIPLFARIKRPPKQGRCQVLGYCTGFACASYDAKG